MASPLRISHICTKFGFFFCIFAISLKRTDSAETNGTELTGGAESRIPIYLGGFFSFGANEGNAWDTSGILAAVEMAIEHVNDRQDILTDYELKMVWNDTKVRPLFNRSV